MRDPVRLVRLFLVFALLAMALPGEAQQPGKVYRVGLIATTTPVAKIRAERSGT